jgi:glycosyltransferase involved in cell wall biosynthesis
MRICHLAASHSTFSGRIFQREALSARRAGLDVTIVAVADRFPAEPLDHGCRIIELPASSRIGKLLTAWRLFRLGRGERCDVYHCHDLVSLTAGAALKLVTGRGLIYDAHEDYPLTHSSNFVRNTRLRRFLRCAFLGYEWLLTRLVDEVFTVDPLIARKFNAMRKTCRVLPNFPRLQGQVPPPYGLPDWNNRLVFVYAGGLSRHVAILEVLAAVDRLRVRHPKVLVVFVGKFWDRPYKERVDAYLREKALDGHVQLLGEIPMVVVPQLLSHCLAGLILYGPTMNYGDKLLYAVKLMEYMAAGLPIIASSFRGLSIMVRRRGCGLAVDPTSSSEIEAAMEKLLSDAGFAEGLATASRRAFATRYHWELVEPKLLAAYNRLAIRGT